MARTSSNTLFLGVVLFLITMIVSASIHVVMLLVFNVPYPRPDVPMLAGVFTGYLPYVLAISFLVFVMGAASSQRSIGFYTLFLFAFMALREELIRVPLMALVASNSLAGPDFIGSLPVYVYYLLFGLIVSPLHKCIKLTNDYLKAVIIMIIAMPILVFSSPVIDSLRESLMTFSSEYNDNVASYYPYGPNVLIIAYATFIPKTIAYFIIWHLFVVRSLAGHWISRIVYVLGTLLCTTGSLLLLLPYQETPLALLYSSSQFLLEDISFAVLTMLFYPWTKRLINLRMVVRSATSDI